MLLGTSRNCIGMSPEVHCGVPTTSAPDPLKESRFCPRTQHPPIALWSPTALGPVTPAHSSRSPGSLSAYPQLGGSHGAQTQKQFPSIFQTPGAKQTSPQLEGGESTLHLGEVGVPETGPSPKSSSKDSSDQPPPLVLLHPDHSYAWTNKHPSETPLGSGYTATVYRGVDISTGSPVAIKVVPKDKQRLLATDGYYRQLYRRLPKQTHPSILQIRDFLEDANNFFIISDLCSGSDLVDYVLNFSPRSTPLEDVRTILRQILVGVHNLHSRGIIHRDLKLDNILFTDTTKKQVNIVDFDMSLMTDYPGPPKPPRRPDEVSVVGTKDYMAPEAYKGVYSEASDLWSVGVILYILLDGHFPFDLAEASSGKDIRDLLRHGVSISSHIVNRCPLAADLLSKLLEFDINLRIKTAWDALRHPWFSCKLTRTSTTGSATWTKSADKENVKVKIGQVKKEGYQPSHVGAKGTSATPNKMLLEPVTYDFASSGALTPIITSTHVSNNAVPTAHSTTIKSHKCPPFPSLPCGSPRTTTCASNPAAVVRAPSPVSGHPPAGQNLQQVPRDSANVYTVKLPPKNTDVVAPLHSARLSAPNMVPPRGASPSGDVSPPTSPASPYMKIERGNDVFIKSPRYVVEGRKVVKQHLDDTRQRYITISSEGSTLASSHERGLLSARLGSCLPDYSKVEPSLPLFWGNSPAASNPVRVEAYRYKLGVPDVGRVPGDGKIRRNSPMTRRTSTQDKSRNSGVNPPHPKVNPFPLEQVHSGYSPGQPERGRLASAQQKKAAISAHKSRVYPSKGRQSITSLRSSQHSPAPSTAVLSRSLGARTLGQVVGKQAQAHQVESQSRMGPEISGRGLQRKTATSRHRPPKDNARSGTHATAATPSTCENQLQTPRRKSCREGKAGKKLSNDNDIAQNVGALEKRKVSSPALATKRKGLLGQRGF